MKVMEITHVKDEEEEGEEEGEYWTNWVTRNEGEEEEEEEEWDEEEYKAFTLKREDIEKMVEEEALEHANIALKVQNMFCVEERGEVKAYVCKKCEKGFPFLGTQQGNTFSIRDSRQATMALTQCKAHLEGHLDLDLKCFYCPNTFIKSSLLRKHLV